MGQRGWHGPKKDSHVPKTKQVVPSTSAPPCPAEVKQSRLPRIHGRPTRLYRCRRVVGTVDVFLRCPIFAKPNAPYASCPLKDSRLRTPHLASVRVWTLTAACSFFRPNRLTPVARSSQTGRGEGEVWRIWFCFRFLFCPCSV